MRKLRLLFALAATALSSIAASAQNHSTTVTLQRVYSQGSIVANGQLCAIAVDQYGNPISFSEQGWGVVQADSPFCATVLNGTLVGGVPVPDAYGSTQVAPIFYNFTLQLTDPTGIPTSAPVKLYNTVAGVTGTMFALDTYAPPVVASMPFNKVFGYGISVPTTCVPPSVWTIPGNPNILTCNNGVFAVGASSLAVGTTAGTAAAGDDPRIVGALKSRGQYNPQGQYSYGDVVVVGSGTAAPSYYSVVAGTNTNTGNQPAPGSAFWQQLGTSGASDYNSLSNKPSTLPADAAAAATALSTANAASAAATAAQAAAGSASTTATAAQAAANNANTNATAAQAAASAASAAAATAQATANSASTAATSAQTASGTASTNATAAQATANNANTTATTAQAAATAASSAAAAAQTTANSASTAATAAQTAAGTASTNATSAQATANNANTTALAAQSAVAGASSAAAAAQTTANSASTAATAAQTAAGTASTNAAAAQSAATAASTAAAAAQAAAANKVDLSATAQQSMAGPLASPSYSTNGAANGTISMIYKGLTPALPPMHSVTLTQSVDVPNAYFWSMPGTPFTGLGKWTYTSGNNTMLLGTSSSADIVAALNSSPTTQLAPALFSVPTYNVLAGTSSGLVVASSSPGGVSTFTIAPDSTHFLPANNGSASQFWNGAGALVTPNFDAAGAAAATPQYKGAYAGGTPYNANDTVSFNGPLYRSLSASNTGHKPNISPSYWTAVSSGPIAQGLAADGVLVSDIATTAGSTTITSATANWTSANAGNLITLTGVGAPPLSTTLSAALSTGGGAITSLPVNATSAIIPAGTYIFMTGNSGNTQQTFLTTSSTAAGSTAIAVGSQVPLYAFPSGTTVQGVVNHLYTTIASVTNATTAVLAAAPSITSTGVEATFGTDDTAALQACINIAFSATPGTCTLPAGMILFNGTLITPAAYSGRLIGQGVFDLSGSVATYGFNALNIPSQPPYMQGTVLVDMASASDAFLNLGLGMAQNFANFGVRFAGAFSNTGHCFNQDPGAGNIGLLDADMLNVHCYGHDGNHYGVRMITQQYNTHTNFRSYGGGMYLLDNLGSTAPTGNFVSIHPYGWQMAAGTASGGINMTPLPSATVTKLNLITYVRPQMWESPNRPLMPGIPPPYAPGGFVSGANYNMLSNTDASVIGVAILQPDYEYYGALECVQLPVINSYWIPGGHGINACPANTQTLNLISGTVYQNTLGSGEVLTLTFSSTAAGATVDVYQGGTNNPTFDVCPLVFPTSGDSKTCTFTLSAGDYFKWVGVNATRAQTYQRKTVSFF